MSQASLSLELGGETLRLDHRRAALAPAHSCLLVADTHFGKSAIFRREGIAIPEGGDAADLARLGALVNDSGSQHLVILGDFVHGYLPAGHAFFEMFNDWRRRHSELAVTLVLGNHDRTLDTAALHNVACEPEHRLSGLLCVHSPEDAHADAIFLAGHIHPCYRLSTRADSLRLPVFWQQAGGLVLPSFGQMTGGFNVQPGPGDRLYAVGPDAVLPVWPPSRTAGRTRR